MQSATWPTEINSWLQQQRTEKAATKSINKSAPSNQWPHPVVLQNEVRNKRLQHVPLVAQSATGGRYRQVFISEWMTVDTSVKQPFGLVVHHQAAVCNQTCHSVLDIKHNNEFTR
jgi:hypothetical protein